MIFEFFPFYFLKSFSIIFVPFAFFFLIRSFHTIYIYISGQWRHINQGHGLCTLITDFMNHGVFICTVVALQGLHSASLFQTNFHSYSTARLNYLRSTARADQGRSYPRIWRLLIPWNLRLDFARGCTDESLFTSGYPERVFDLNHDFIISGV